MLSCFFLLGYCLLNKYQNGECTISKISLNNSLANVIASNSYKKGNDKEFINIIDTAKNDKGKFGLYPAVFYINNEWIRIYKKNDLEFKKNENISKRLVDTDETLFISNFPNSKIYSIERLNAFVYNSKISNEYFKYVVSRFINTVINHVFIFSLLIVSFVFAYYEFKKIRQINYFIVFTVMIALAHIFTITFIVGQFTTHEIGQVDDFERLNVPIAPLLYILGIYVFDSLIRNLHFKQNNA